MWRFVHGNRPPPTAGLVAVFRFPLPVSLLFSLPASGQVFASHSRARRRGRRENAPRPGCGRLALVAGGLSLAASELARSRAAWLLLHGACPGHVRRTWLVRIFLLYGTLQGGMKRTRSVKGKNRLDFGFRPRENVILPRFWLTKGKNCAILGFQQAFLSWLPIPR